MTTLVLIDMHEAGSDSQLKDSGYTQLKTWNFTLGLLCLIGSIDFCKNIRGLQHVSGELRRMRNTHISNILYQKSKAAKSKLNLVFYMLNISKAGVRAQQGKC